MSLEALHRITFACTERHGTGPERLLFAEGRCAGRLGGRFRAANRARLVPEDARSTWLDDTVAAVAGEVYPRGRVVLDVAALVWEPLPESAGYDLSG
jgi:hypothetical protein